MAKSKNHTANNQSYKAHKNGIQKPKRHRFRSLKGGEYVAAEHLETIYARCPLVAQIFVYGDSFQNHLVCIVVPDADRIIPSAVELGVLSKTGDDVEADMKTVCASPVIKDAIMTQVKEKAKEVGLAGFEVVKSMYLEPEPFTVENNLMTPSFKQKRTQLRDHYRAVLDQMYANAPPKK